MLGRKASPAFKSFLENVIQPSHKGRSRQEINNMVDHVLKTPQLQSYFKKNPQSTDVLRKLQSYVDQADKLIPAVG